TKHLQIVVVDLSGFNRTSSGLFGRRACLERSNHEGGVQLRWYVRRQGRGPHEANGGVRRRRTMSVSTPARLVRLPHGNGARAWGYTSLARDHWCVPELRGEGRAARCSEDGHGD